jgi:hypothetical protein
MRYHLVADAMQVLMSFQPGPPRVGTTTRRMRANGAFLAGLVALSEYGLFAALDLVRGQKPFLSYAILIGVPVAIAVGAVAGPAAARSDATEAYPLGLKIGLATVILGATCVGVAMAIASSDPGFRSDLAGKIVAGIALGVVGAAFLGLPALGLTLPPALVWVALVRWANDAQPSAVVTVGTEFVPWPTSTTWTPAGLPETA